MTVLIYDASWEGFLSAVFEVYERRLQEATITQIAQFQPGIFGSAVEVSTDDTKAKRVWSGLRKCLSAKGLNDVYSCFLSEIIGIENHLLAFIKVVLSIPGSEYSYGNASVLKVSQVSKMVHREKHRMEAFVRFKLTKDEIFYAVVEPDYNVLPLILSHFKKRYADQRWLIYDLKRNYGIYFDLNEVEEVTLQARSDSDENIFCDVEEEYQTLWKDYFTHVNISERKNTKLHIRHVPKRYWKHLTEKNL